MRRTIALLLFASTVSCQDYLFDRVRPEHVKESRIDVTVAPSKADILFVVDNSGSMADEQMKLAASFERFIRAIAGDSERGLYHIAIVTTDLDPGRPERSGMIEFDFGPEPYKAWLGGVKSSTCKTIDPPLAHGCFRGPIIRTGEMSESEEVDIFTASVDVGSCGSGAEQGLSAMIRALEQMDDGECNQNFLRPDANLVVIVVSDENEATPFVPAPTPVDIVDQLSLLKPIEKVRFAAVVGAVDGVAASCRIADGGTTDVCGSICTTMRPPADGSHEVCTADSQCPSGQSCQGIPDLPRMCENELLENWADCASCSFYQVADCCSANAGHRYVEFARELERRVTARDPSLIATECKESDQGVVSCLVDSICQENFGDTLARIAEELVVPTSFQLDPPAVYPEGVKVRIRGGRFGESGVDLDKSEYSVSSDGRVLVLSNGRRPVRGETVEIFFVIER